MLGVTRTPTTKTKSQESEKTNTKSQESEDTKSQNQEARTSLGSSWLQARPRPAARSPPAVPSGSGSQHPAGAEALEAVALTWPHPPTTARPRLRTLFIVFRWSLALRWSWY